MILLVVPMPAGPSDVWTDDFFVNLAVMLVTGFVSSLIGWWFRGIHEKGKRR